MTIVILPSLSFIKFDKGLFWQGFVNLGLLSIKLFVKLLVFKLFEDKDFLKVKFSSFLFSSSASFLWFCENVLSS